LRARDKLSVPVQIEPFRELVPDRFTQPPMRDRAYDTKEEVGETVPFIAASSVMRKVYAEVELLAKLDVPILILGESGSGKRTVGRLIHKLSHRSANKFLNISCAAFDPDLLERELFDPEHPAHEISSFAICKGGTLLLEDIDELPARAQARLLCLLQEKHAPSEKQSLGQSDVRILASATAISGDELREKKLRKELYYCLSAFTIVVPPLRQRKDEMPLLLQHFMNRIAANYLLPTRDFSQAVLRICQRYSWPGNLRELEKFVKRYVVSGEGETPRGSGELDNSQAQTRTSNGAMGADFERFECMAAMSASKSLLHTVRKEAERNAISTVLEQTRWNRAMAARRLHVSYRTLLYKIQQYDLDPPK